MLEFLFVRTLLRVRICKIPIKISKSNSDHFKGTLIFRHIQFVTILTFSYMFIRVFSFFLQMCLPSSCIFHNITFSNAIKISTDLQINKSKSWIRNYYDVKVMIPKKLRNNYFSTWIDMNGVNCKNVLSTWM